MSATTAERKQVTITTDGACLGNGQNETRAAAAAILEYQGHKRAIGCYIGPSTNQRAEITATAFALESLKEPCTVILRTDSRYVVETMTGNFKRRSNLDCWQRLDEAATTHEITYEGLCLRKGIIGRFMRQLAFLPQKGVFVMSLT